MSFVMCLPGGWKEGRGPRGFAKNDIKAMCFSGTSDKNAREKTSGALAAVSAA